MWLIQLALIQQLQLLWAYLTELPLSIQLLWNWYWSISIKHKKVLFVIFAGNSLHYLSSICLAAASASYFKVIVMHSTQCRLKYKKRKEKKERKYQHGHDWSHFITLHLHSFNISPSDEWGENICIINRFWLNQLTWTAPVDEGSANFSLLFPLHLVGWLCFHRHLYWCKLISVYPEMSWQPSAFLLIKWMSEQEQIVNRNQLQHTFQINRVFPH